MSAVEIKIINKSSNPLPAYATAGSSGMDLRANLDSPTTLQPFERGLIPTGLFIELPEGYEAQIRPRSGLAIKQGITCLNTPGTIDADYRGEIKIILINLSQEEQVIQHGDRIAQMVFQRVEKGIWIETEQLELTSRNAGGFRQLDPQHRTWYGGATMAEICHKGTSLQAVRDLQTAANAVLARRVSLFRSARADNGEPRNQGDSLSRQHLSYFEKFSPE